MVETILTRLIKILDLQPLPGEGGLFYQSYKSEDIIPIDVLPERYTGSHAFCTAIYYLLSNDPDSFSAFHRLPTDEIYHFYLGDPVEMHLLFPDGTSQLVLLGSDLFGGQQVQFVVPCGVWQGSRLKDGGRFALLGTTMSPGFETSDYVPGDREALIRQFPDHVEWIQRLTRQAHQP